MGWGGQTGWDGVARREGEGRARRGRREGWPDGGGDGRRDWEVAKREGGGQTGSGRCQTGGGGGGCLTGWGGVSDGDLWGLDGIEGCPNGKDAGDGRGRCPNKGEG
jgi:hypothetical protein